MNKLRHLLLIMLLFAGAVLGGAISGRVSTVNPTQAQQADEHARGQAWEYCALSKAGYVNASAGDVWIAYFRSNGVQVVDVQAAASEGNGAAMAKAIAKLGAEGWEMVGQGPLDIRQGTLTAIYFKRAK